jgi:hypothetical protein
MHPVGTRPLELNGEEIEILAELLEAARTKLLVEIRHTHHRAFRDDLRERLDRMVALLERIRQN